LKRKKNHPKVVLMQSGADYFDAAAAGAAEAAAAGASEAAGAGAGAATGAGAGAGAASSFLPQADSATAAAITAIRARDLFIEVPVKIIRQFPEIAFVTIHKDQANMRDTNA
jgi:hypothetical protein